MEHLPKKVQRYASIPIITSHLMVIIPHKKPKKVLRILEDVVSLEGAMKYIKVVEGVAVDERVNIRCDYHHKHSEIIFSVYLRGEPSVDVDYEDLIELKKRLPDVTFVHHPLVVSFFEDVSQE